jgi:hypothetical protein
MPAVEAGGDAESRFTGTLWRMLEPRLRRMRCAACHAAHRASRSPAHRASRSPAHGASRSALFGALIVLAIVTAGCGSSIPVVSFDPATPCTTDGRQPGAYPELEALLPTTYEGNAPGNVDSGRSCTAAALGNLADAGIEGVKFAGATWSLGGTTALTVAVFQADGLTPAEMIEFYRAGAIANSKTERLLTSEATVGDHRAPRLDVLQSDGTGQTIVAWPASGAGRVYVLLAADLGDARVLKALATFASL